MSSSATPQPRSKHHSTDPAAPSPSSASDATTAKHSFIQEDPSDQHEPRLYEVFALSGHPVCSQKGQEFRQDLLRKKWCQHDLPESLCLIQRCARAKVFRADGRHPIEDF